ncbi:MAG: lyase family protein [Candidatus Aenigmarchaeota archaeon]|jgi:adenylosuccinate lyase|nr:lyase family protein [Candidatus Aenigmarchaeota archaeon]
MDILEAITPIDGRYKEKLSGIENYFSEYALIKERIRVEIEYLIKLVEEVEKERLNRLPKDWKETLRKIHEEFNLEDAKRVKEIEKNVGHDVFAVVKFIAERLESLGLNELKSLVHLGLTSDDINNIAYSSLLKRFNREVFIPSLIKLLDKIVSLSMEYKDTIMLARTHGMPAVPTTFGRFLINYAYRIAIVLEELYNTKFYGKIGGAVGDFNALKFLYPTVDWISFAKHFIESQGLEYFPANTQILPHDKISDYLSKVALIASILSNLCRDLWMLNMLRYISFTFSKSEVHSSTMPHKVNPLLIENAEGCFDLSSEILAYMNRRLISIRLHRDLSDSVIKRFYGLPLSLIYLGITNLISAFEKMLVNKEAMYIDVRNHPETLSELYQLYLKKIGFFDAYETIQKLTREKPEKILEEIKKLIPKEKFVEIEKLTVLEYSGEAQRIVELLAKEIESLKKKFL